jgi:hypothetical protein
MFWALNAHLQEDTLYTCSIWYCHSLREFVVACRCAVQEKTYTFSKTLSNVYVFSLLLLLIVKELWPEDGQTRPKYVVIVKPINHDLTTVVFWQTHQPSFLLVCLRLALKWLTGCEVQSHRWHEHIWWTWDSSYMCYRQYFNIIISQTAKWHYKICLTSSSCRHFPHSFRVIRW